MDAWLKALVAAACCVIIAGGGYFAWTKWQESKRAALQADYDHCLEVAEWNKLYETGGDTSKLVVSKDAAAFMLESCRQRFKLPAT